MISQQYLNQIIRLEKDGRLTKLHKQQDNTVKPIIEHYEISLDLWKDADPGIAEVEDAKKRLAGLKSN